MKLILQEQEQMVNKNKIKGTTWEREFVELLENNIDGVKAKRIAGSGSLGTNMGEPLLSSDVVVNFKNIPFSFRVECKTGYGGATQLTVKKEWLEKIRREAENTFSVPLLAGKFYGSRPGMKFIIMDFKAFSQLMNYISELENGD